MKQSFIALLVLCITTSTTVQPFGARKFMRRMPREQREAKMAEIRARREKAAALLGEDMPSKEEMRKKKRAMRDLSREERMKQRDAFKAQRKAKMERIKVMADDGNAEAAELYNNMIATKAKRKEMRHEFKVKRKDRKALMRSALGEEKMAELDLNQDWKSRRKEMHRLPLEERIAKRREMRKMKRERRQKIKAELTAQAAEGNEQAAELLEEMSQRTGYGRRRSRRSAI